MRAALITTLVSLAGIAFAAPPGSRGGLETRGGSRGICVPKAKRELENCLDRGETGLPCLEAYANTYAECRGFPQRFGKQSGSASKAASSKKFSGKPAKVSKPNHVRNRA
ncbi:uncharacterized protein MAM_07381 [Metarhizium album ARSEF 1941]|uniref:Uncharacterized protein n=1 Tax=Metarhizium album (strain ARSEF 1941) TaxID=1081103 RepID=A0A0B2WP72_METAS|nr:uncharacterized protein MAM_07381 [Metarhizium album ARSEF 1941]KHN94785.1 hypothetical protein MAM_07381 [Metarhizium album ARSEF 1941]